MGLPKIATATVCQTGSGKTIVAEQLTEAKELARHSDVNMTMRYTYIGINDQARGFAAYQPRRRSRQRRAERGRDEGWLSEDLAAWSAVRA